jgi:porphobilinogen synthase
VSATRLRRLRGSPLLREIFRETAIQASDLCWPVFVAEGLAGPEEIPSLPGQSRHSIDSMLGACEAAAEAGVRSVCLFGVPRAKTEDAAAAWREDGIVQQALRALRSRGFPLVLMADTCLCQYTANGHCGLVRDGIVDDDATVPVLARVAASQAAAGADVVVPSDMMDGRVAAMRESLDAQGLGRTAILSHAVKYASAYYGPFREAASSAPAFGDRRTHQMDPGNVREAVRSARRDVAEGADAVLVKPALAYLDVVRAVRESVDVPVAAYAVSGEYAMIEAAGRAGWIDRDAVLLETLLGMRRAGASLVLTYHAIDAARLLTELR